jgi:cytochrome P450
MWRLADQQLDAFVERGKCEFMEDYARPFSGLVIADLLGIPTGVHEESRAVYEGQVVGGVEDVGLTQAHNPLEWMNEKFDAFITDRRREPRSDVLTELAEAKYPDGSTPEVIDVVRLATFLFAAGQETTTKLLSAALRVIAERPDIQKMLREDRDLIPGFLEETLRMESPVKSHFRMARTSTTVGDVKIPADQP